MSATDPHDCARCSREYIGFSPHQWRLPVTPVWRFGKQGHPGVWDDLFVAFALAHCVPVARTTTHRNLPVRDAKETIEKFGPLKALLGAIPAVYANHEVRQQALSKILPLTKTFSGIRGYRKENRSPPLTHCWIRAIARFVPQWRGRAGASG